MSGNPNLKLRLKGQGTQAILSDLKKNRLNAQLQGLSMKTKFDAALLKETQRFLAVQNFLWRVPMAFRVLGTVNTLISWFSPTWRDNLDNRFKANNRLRRLYFSKLEISESQLLSLISAFNLKIQTSIYLKAVGLSQSALDLLIKKIQADNTKLDKLNLSGNDLSGLDLNGLIEAIANDTLRVQKLDLSNTQINDDTVNCLVDAMKTNTHIEALYGPHQEHQQKLDAITERNAWLQDIQKRNPYDILDLIDEGNLKSEQFEGLGLLIQKNRYRKIETTARIDQNSLNHLLPYLRQSSVTRLMVNASDVSFETSKAKQNLLKIQRGIRKIFGKGSPYLGRSTMTYGLFGGNFFYSVASTLASPYAFLWAGLGFALFGGMRLAANAYFYRALKQTKADDYWEHASHQAQYLAGFKAAHEYLPWLNYKAWTTPGYLGYVLEQNHICPIVEEKTHSRPHV